MIQTDNLYLQINSEAPTQTSCTDVELLTGQYTPINKDDRPMVHV